MPIRRSAALGTSAVIKKKEARETNIEPHPNIEQRTRGHQFHQHVKDILFYY